MLDGPAMIEFRPATIAVNDAAATSPPA